MMNPHFKRLTLRASLFFLLSICLYLPALAGPESPLAAIGYNLSMPQPSSHLFEVSIKVEVGGEANTETLDFQMPRWSPGRYAIFDFAKNVQEFKAASTVCPPQEDCEPGQKLPVTRLDDQTWRVATRGQRRVEVSYKVFGDDLSGTFSQLNERHANFNGGSIFMYVVGHKQDPVTLRIEPPPGWRIINAASLNENQREWRFPNYDLLIDTPTEVAPDWTLDEFKVDGRTYRVVVHSLGDEGGRRKAFVRDIERIVRAETEMWGAPEFESYTFLIHFAADGRSGDGMEHLTSTQIIEPGVLAELATYNDAVDTVSHEFFHVWNAKRLRPSELGPWDFTRPVSTRGLWVAEGITNYYGHLMQRRAKIWTDSELLRTLGQIISDVENAPGSRLMSAEESSISAPFLDGTPHAQRTNLNNTSVSYYYKGEVLGLVLDLLMRGRTKGRASLDDVLRRLYEELYLKSPQASYYLRGRGYTPQDVERIASEVAGTDFGQFFESYVRGTQQPPYDEAFAVVGLRLVREPTPQSYTAGITLDTDNSSSMKITGVRPDSPAARAGIIQGDVLLSINGTAVNATNWQTTLNRYQEGASIPFIVRRNNRTQTALLTIGPPEHYDYRIEEKKDASTIELALRRAWLNQSMNAER
ncbi:MAG TPA: PDZ domain-containing protein [Pyrinomonadaceae bacterium]|jgi:predicted metalloprotease with PDZ domain